MDECVACLAAAVKPSSTGWHVVAGPFIRADRLRAFLAAVGRLDGVTELVAERFQLGELWLRLRYSGDRPLAEALAALPEFSACTATGGSEALRVTLTDAPRGGSCSDTIGGSHARVEGA